MTTDLTNAQGGGEPIAYGPAMARLSTKKRGFVLALINDVPPGENAEVSAAILAGYPDKNMPALRATAKRLISDPAVVEALIEAAKERVHRVSVPLALQTVEEELVGRGKDKVKVALAILNRVYPEKQIIEATVQTVDHTSDALAHLRRLKGLGVGREVLMREFGELGLAHYERLLSDSAKVIEGEIIDATPEDDDPLLMELKGLVS